MLLDDLIDDAQSANSTDGGWGQLIKLAAEFPVDSLSFASPVSVAIPAAPALLPQPRQVSYERANDLVDGAGDGPCIGLGVGMALTTT